MTTLNVNLPLGVRLNNPGNLEWGNDKWQGMIPREKSAYYKTGTKQQKRFMQFESAVMGIRAIAVTLITYYDRRKANDGSKIDTPLEIVERWAPSIENDVSAYALQLGKALCSDLVCTDPKRTVVNMHDYKQLRTLVEAIIRHENGKGPYKTLNEHYPEDVIDRALELAGVFNKTKVVARLPVTKEVVAGSATGVIGIAQLAEVAPQAIDALTQNQDHLTSGNISKIILGSVLVLLAIFVAWSQIKKHQLGVN